MCLHIVASGCRDHKPNYGLKVAEWIININMASSGIRDHRHENVTALITNINVGLGSRINMASMDNIDHGHQHGPW